MSSNKHIIGANRGSIFFKINSQIGIVAVSINRKGKDFEASK